MFDAYTVKKVLPRLVIAVVLIQLSWFIFTGMIALTNAIAYGIEGLIYAPFGGLGDLGLSDILEYGGGGGGGIFLGMAAGVGVWGGLSLFGGGALALAGLAFLSLLIGFLLLLVRQVVIVALLIVSPLALVAWILPNTEKFWKIWWESFSKLLIVYPLILGVIAAGRVFAYIIAGVDPSSGDGIASTVVDNIATVFLIVVALFGPYMLIPKLFQLAGGAFAALKGLSDGGSKGVFDGLRKTRGEKRAQVKETGVLLKNANNPFARRANKIASGRALGLSGGLGFGNRGAAGREEQKHNAANNLGKDQKFVQATYDDEVRRALQLGSDDKAQAAGISAEKRAIAKRIGYNNASQLAAIKAEGNNKGRNWTGPNATEKANEAIAAAAAASGVDEKSLREEVAYGLRTNGGRFDLGALDPGKSAEEQVLNGSKKASLYQLGNGQPETVTAMARHARNLLASGDPKQQHQAAMIYEELDALSKNASGGVRDAAVEGKQALEAAPTPGLPGISISDYYNSGTPVDVPVFGQTTAQIANPAAGAPGHHPGVAPGTMIEVTKQAQIGVRQESDLKVRASTEARKYEPPDPNVI